MSHDALHLAQNLAAKKDALLEARAAAVVAQERAEMLGQAEEEYAAAVAALEEAGRVAAESPVVIIHEAPPLPAPEDIVILPEAPLPPAPEAVEVTVVAPEPGEVAIVAPAPGEAVLVLPPEPIVHEHRCGKCGGKKHGP